MPGTAGLIFNFCSIEIQPRGRFRQPAPFSRIVFDSGYAHTTRLADSVAEGVARVPGAEVSLIKVGESPILWDTLEASDAIIFGSPTYNGMFSARLKQFFEDATKPVWNDLKWCNKIAAGFANSGAHSGDKLNVLVSMAQTTHLRLKILADLLCRIRQENRRNGLPTLAGKIHNGLFI